MLRVFISVASAGTILSLLGSKTILLLSCCMAYSGKHLISVGFKHVHCSTHTHTPHASLGDSPCVWYLSPNPYAPSTGLELSFYSGVYGTCLGSTSHFEHQANGLIGLSGIVVGVGEIVGELKPCLDSLGLAP